MTETSNRVNNLHLNELQIKLNYSFNNIALLAVALTHSSYANEHKRDGFYNNERLEFLGDSVLGLSVAELIYKHKSKIPEGQMTKLRSELVCEKSLTSVAESLDLGSYLLLGKGEEKGGGRSRPSILADAVEAVLAAIYLDGGLQPVISFVKEKLFLSAEIYCAEATDYKTALQELIQMKQGQSLSYHVIEESGPDHMKLFTVEVRLNGKFYGAGTGKSKKEAEQAAAMFALQKKESRCYNCT